MTWTGDITTLTFVFDRVSWILQSVWSPIILGVFGFALLSLFLHFRK